MKRVASLFSFRGIDLEIRNVFLNIFYRDIPPGGPPGGSHFKSAVGNQIPGECRGTRQSGEY